jgi:sugar phosphate isomerase/epimerase
MEQNKNVSRRGFIGAAIGTGAAAAMTPSVALGGGKHGDDHGHGSSDSVPRNRRGMQMWSMRRLIEEGIQTPAQVFRTLGRLGYSEIEKFTLHGLTVDQFKRALRDAGLRCPSGHDGPGFPATGNWEPGYRQTLEDAVKIGQKYTGLAWFGETDTIKYANESTWHMLAEHLNRAGEIADEYGLQFFYHNHDFEFANRQADGTPMYNILLEETDADLVKFELDLYWIVYGGESPVHYLSEDPARFPLYHVKDRTWRDRPNDQDWEDTGPGSIDFPDIFEAGDGRRLDKHFIIEHDWPLLSHPGERFAEYLTAEVSIDYLRTVRW